MGCAVFIDFSRTADGDGGSYGSDVFNRRAVGAAHAAIAGGNGDVGIRGDIGCR